MSMMRYQQALVAAVRDEMTADDNVIYLGEDVEQSLRGVSVGLANDFPGRVMDTPISEAAFTGFATGAAMVGRRPIVEFQIPSLLYVAFDQIVNQAQKIRLMTGGQVSVAVTYLFPGSGARLGLAGQHSDHPYSVLAHLGVKTIVPATADDAYSLMRAAIRDDDPVAVFAPAACLPRRSEVRGEIGRLGTARVEVAGDDLTIVAIGHLVHEAVRLADELRGRVDIEVLNARSVFPFDWPMLASSLRKTGRLLVADDSGRSCGFAGEIVATAAEEMSDLLVAPAVRITRAEATVPFAVELERAIVPSGAELRRGVARLFPHLIDAEEA